MGEICCVAPTCADDMLVLTDEEVAMQSLLNMAVDNSILGKYLLQPVKSVLLYILNITARRSITEVKPQMLLKGETMPVVSELYSSLKYLSTHDYWPGRKHPLI